MFCFSSFSAGIEWGCLTVFVWIRHVFYSYSCSIFQYVFFQLLFIHNDQKISSFFIFSLFFFLLCEDVEFFQYIFFTRSYIAYYICAISISFFVCDIVECGGQCNEYVSFSSRLRHLMQLKKHIPPEIKRNNIHSKSHKKCGHPTNPTEMCFITF